MGTLGKGGIISVLEVREEIERLRVSWRPGSAEPREDLLATILDEDTIARLDLFESAQLSEVVRVCRSSRSMSDAGRKLFAVSRQKKRTANDADRLKKYLSRFGLTWADVSST
jgi:transcriptional regulatory protein RtcR